MTALDDVKGAQAELHASTFWTPGKRGFQTTHLWKCDLALQAALADLAVPVPPPPPTPTPPPSSGPVFGGPNPYAATSPWNTPIPANPAIHSDSAHMVNDHITGGYGEPVGWGPIAGYNYSRWLGPREACARNWSKVADGLTQVIVGGATHMVPVPSPFLLPHLGSSKETRAVIHADDGSTWVCYYVTTPAENADGHYHATILNQRSTGNGWQGQGDGNGGVAGAASYIPYDAGALTPWDFLNTAAGGHFSHALGVTISSSANGATAGHPLFTYPAVRGDGKTVGTLGIPLGAQLQLDPSINIDARTEPEWLKQILRTMQTYGVIATDTASGQGDGDGITTLMHECGPAGYTYPFAGLGAYANGVPLDLMSRFRVLDWNH